ncbi:metal ABC transporter solute-binding protein, Zn/Mn family [Calothrix sp. 336/3]|uniref:metal ABC transporter solute-binding protein, Zn/Mn family n=1 Tax=Calothrix sp. 336/3 TaxID=1337936 RepID=UPI0004E445EC|nr:zinc ABC transporter substrate-binding protein [Calothrix sp. 336/3]AKG23169.1 ABC transporter substrate-binding protein [Calothrix sp. 336/3]
MSANLHLFSRLSIVVAISTIGLWGCDRPGSFSNTSYTTSVTQTTVTPKLPKVVATTKLLCDLTKQVAKNTIDLTCLLPGNTNPYTYQPTPEDKQAIAAAKLILYSGYNLEPNLFKTIRNTKTSGAKIAVIQRAVPKPLQIQEDGKIIPDPYVWHNVQNASRMVEVIRSNLAKISPKNASTYSQNGNKIKKEFTQLDAWIKKRIASIPETNRKLITTQDNMAYYATSYGLAYAGGLTAIPSQAAKNNGRIHTIFTETTTNPKLLKTIGKETKIKVAGRKLYTDDLGGEKSEAKTYQKMMTTNTRTIVEALGGTYLIFENHKIK